MADKDPDLDGPSLELPSFGFGRKRGRERPIAEQAPTAEPPQEARETGRMNFPTIAALPAVLLVGLVVGLAAVLFTYGSLRLCDAATGTDSCGGGAGLLMLLAILIALTYLGGWLLRGLGIGDAGSTSFLAVGLLLVVVMLFLLESLDERWTVVVVPLVAVASYALSWRATTALTGVDADQG